MPSPNYSSSSAPLSAGETALCLHICHWWHFIFADESRFKLHHTDGRARVHRWQGERHIDVLAQERYGNVGSPAFAWVGFHFGGKSELVLQDDTRNQEVYSRAATMSLTLGKSHRPEQLWPGPENAPSHTAWATMDFLESRDVEVMDLLSKSPNKSPMECLWHQMMGHIRGIDNSPNTAVPFRVAVQQACVALGHVRIRTLLWSMPHQARAVLTVRWGKPAINQPSRMPFLLSTDLQNQFEKKSMSALFATGH